MLAARQIVPANMANAPTGIYRLNCNYVDDNLSHRNRCRGYLFAPNAASLQNAKSPKFVQPRKPCRKQHLCNAALSTANRPPFMQSVPTVVYNIVTCFHNNTSSHESSPSCPCETMQSIDLNALKIGVSHAKVAEKTRNMGRCGTRNSSSRSS